MVVEDEIFAITLWYIYIKIVAFKFFILRFYNLYIPLKGYFIAERKEGKF